MAITLDQAKNLKVGTILYHVKNKNADGTPQRWRVNGKVKTWKRDTSEIRIPVKHGLRTHDYITWHELHLVCLNAEEAID